MNKTVDFWPLSLLQPFAWLEASIPPCVKPIGVLPTPEQGGFPGVIRRRLRALNGIYEMTVMLHQSPLEHPRGEGTICLKAQTKEAASLCPSFKRPFDV